MKKILAILSILIIGNILYSQEKSSSNTDDIIFNALHDEILRDMDSLRLPEHSPPFYIGFHYSQSKQYKLSASLGAIVQDNYEEVPSYSSRLIIGDYQLTDENFESSSTFMPSGETGIRINPPLEADYYGIRRSIWASMEGLFRSANMHYKIKNAFLLKNHISKDEYFLADLSQEKPLVKRFEGAEIKYNKDKWKEKIKDLSKIFLQYPQITKSGITLNIVDANIYYHNSEGFEIKIPHYFSLIQVETTILMEEGDDIQKSLLFLASTPDSLPSFEKLQQRITEFADYTISLLDAPILQEKYSGPIIFEGKAAGKYMFQCLFNADKALFAKRIPLEDNSSNLYMPKKAPYNSIEAKIGEEIFHPSLTITDISNQKNYNGKRMMGYYPVDAEGIVPTPNFTLVQDGILKNLYNSRIPSLSYDHSNGHKRAFITSQGHLGKILSPGILKIESEDTYKEKKIRKLAKQYAKKQKLDYYIVIKDMIGEKPDQMYKVDIKTGKETLIRGVDFISHPIDALDSKGKFGNNESITHSLFNVPITIISPSLFLLPKLDLIGTSRIEQNSTPIVKSPLKRK